MTPKHLALIGGGITVVGGVVTGAYFLMPEKEKPQASKQPAESAPHTDLREALKGVVFLTIEGDSHKEQWGKLVDKFLTSNPGVKKIVTGEIKTAEPNNNKDSNIEALKKACGELLKKTDFQEKDKTIAKNWCATTSTLLAVSG